MFQTCIITSNYNSKTPPKRKDQMVKLIFCHHSLIGILPLKVTAKTNEKYILPLSLSSFLTFQDFNENMHRTLNCKFSKLMGKFVKYHSLFFVVFNGLHKKFSRIELIHSEDCKCRMHIISYSHLQFFRKSAESQYDN